MNRYLLYSLWYHSSIDDVFKKDRFMYLGLSFRRTISFSISLLGGLQFFKRWLRLFYLKHFGLKLGKGFQ